MLIVSSETARITNLVVPSKSPFPKCAETLSSDPTCISWPTLDEIGLSPSEVEARRSGLGGSDANVILSGDPDRVIALWTVKRGEAPAEDLSDRLPVMLGSWTETFNRHWYERETGLLVSQVGKRLTCAQHGWRSCTLDGYVPVLGAVWEAKHTSAFTSSNEVVERYMPQLQHNMAVAQAERAVLSVIFGNAKWEVFEIAADWMYQEDLLIAEARFWDCVRTGERPVPAPVPAAPKPIGVREICLERSNSWASAAVDWLQFREPARLHSAATVALKELVEGDVKRAFGHGVEARRSKSGAISIREMGQ